MTKIFTYIVCLLLLSSCNNQIEPKLIKSSLNDNEINSQSKVDDIDDWDIEIEKIYDMYFYFYNPEKGEKWQDYQIEDQDKVRIIDSFNAIKRDDIYWDISNDEDLYGAFFPYIKIIFKDGTQKMISINPFLWIDVNEYHYYTNFQLEFYDVLRELQPKYGYPYVNYESEIPNYEIDGNGLFSVCKNNFIVNPDKDISTTLNNFDYKSNYENQTFSDLIEPFIGEIELNDVVETKDLKIKVIEIKDGKITAVAVSLK